jgi:hypothetical protein
MVSVVALWVLAARQSSKSDFLQLTSGWEYEDGMNLLSVTRLPLLVGEARGFAPPSCDEFAFSWTSSLFNIYTGGAKRYIEIWVDYEATAALPLLGSIYSTAWKINSANFSLLDFIH